MRQIVKVLVFHKYVKLICLIAYVEDNLVVRH